jgi:rod shape determining protein RodA
VLIAVVLLLSAYGTIMVRSAVTGMDGAAGMVRRQLIGFAIGALFLAAAWALDYRRLSGWVGPLVMLTAVMVVSPMIPGLGASAKGAKLWLEIGGLRLFQPSEPSKLLFIIALSAVVARYKGQLSRGADVAKVVGIAAIPTLLVVAVGDLGTGLVFVAITAGILLIGGLDGRWFALFALVGVVLVGGTLWLNVVVDRVSGQDRIIKDYQMNRLMVFIDPELDPTGAGYNLEQSKIAIGSGELTGKGLRSGTQSRLNFLPERHTDFIFSALGEQLGFMGSVLLLGLYLVLLVTALEVSAQSRDLYGSLIVAGVISMWTFQILENMGMTIGLMPITGIPLPFMSYGSSFMVTNMAAVGMLLSVWARRR